MIKFLYLVNKMGRPRLVKYYKNCPHEQKISLERDIVKECLTKSSDESNFFDHGDIKVIFRKYATLYFILGVDEEENELAILEFIHNIVETLNRYFNGVCEMDIMFNIDRIHFILEEMIHNGCIVETSRNTVLSPVLALDQS